MDYLPVGRGRDGTPVGPLLAGNYTENGTMGCPHQLLALFLSQVALRAGEIMIPLAMVAVVVYRRREKKSKKEM